MRSSVRFRPPPPPGCSRRGGPGRRTDEASWLSAAPTGVRFRPPPPPGLAVEVALVADPTKPLGCRLRGAGFDYVPLPHSARSGLRTVGRRWGRDHAARLV